MDITLICMVVLNCVWLILLFLMIRTRKEINLIQEFSKELIEESEKWREAYINKEHGSTIINNNSEGGTRSTEEQSDLEQQNQEAMDAGVQPEDYSHIFSKKTQTPVQFGEDVSD